MRTTDKNLRAMTNSSSVLLILHLTFIAFFLGGQFYYLAITQPASHQFFSVNDQIRFLQNVLKRQNPFLLLCLCLVVVTGGLMITPIKGELGNDYFSAFGAKLLVKLSWFFVVFFVSAYQALSVGFRIRFLDPASMEKNLESKLTSVRTRMTVTSIANIILIIYIVWIARE